MHKAVLFWSRPWRSTCSWQLLIREMVVSTPRSAWISKASSSSQLSSEIWVAPKNVDDTLPKRATSRVFVRLSRHFLSKSLWELNYNGFLAACQLTATGFDFDSAQTDCYGDAAFRREHPQMRAPFRAGSLARNIACWGFKAIRLTWQSMPFSKPASWAAAAVESFTSLISAYSKLMRR